MRHYIKRIVSLWMVLAILCTVIQLPAQAQEASEVSIQAVSTQYPSTHGYPSYAEIMAKADFYESVEPYMLSQEELEDYIAYKLFTFTEELNLTGCNLTGDDIDRIVRRTDYIAPWYAFFLDSTKIYDSDGKTIRVLKCRYQTINRTEELKAQEKRVLALVDGVQSDVAKALVIHDFVCKETSYVLNAERTIFDVVLNKTAQCEGYAKVYAYYMNLVGVPCEYIVNQTVAGAHAWNRIYLDGQWYLVDPTWDDVATGSKRHLNVAHSYFLKSAKQFPMHTIELGDQERCTDDRYADAFWTKENAAYSAYGDYIIYPSRNTDSNVLRCHRLGTDPITQEGKEICRIDNWRNSSGQAVTDNYCTPVFYNGRLYYNTPLSVVSCDLDGKNLKVLVNIAFPVLGQPNIGKSESIFSLELRDGTLFIETAANTDAWLANEGCKLYTYNIDPSNAYVKPARVISTKEESLTLAVGENNRVYMPYQPSQLTTISSSDPSICEIGSDGFIVGKTPGTTTLVLTTEETWEYAAGRKIIPVEVTEKPVVDISKDLGCILVEGTQPFTYTGSEICPPISVQYVYGITEADYDVTYENNIEAGMAKVIVTAKGDVYRGTLVGYFRIVKEGADETPTPEPTPTPTPTPKIALKSVTPETDTYDYTGSAISPTITVIDSNGNVVPSTGYDVVYTGNVNVGVATVTVTGTGNYTGTVSTTFTIVTADLSKGTLELPRLLYSYTGEEIKPTVTVKDADGAVVPATGYVVTYSDHVNVGVATVTVTGVGNYTGTLSATFTITAQSGGNGTGTGNIPVIPPADLDPADGTITTVVQERGNGTYRVFLMQNGKIVHTVEEGISVTIPLEGKATSGSVLILVGDDGEEKLVRTSIVDGDSIKGKLTRSGTVKVADRSVSFQDVENHWAKDAIDFVSSRGLFLGVDGISFAADTMMNRAMLVTVLHRLEDMPQGTGTGFADVAGGQWYSDAVLWASGKGIVNGAEGVFQPDSNVTREQIAVFLYRYGAEVGLDTAVTGSLDVFNDAAEVSDWASEAMQWAVGAGVIGGTSDGMLEPGVEASRGEVATMIMRFVSVMNA